MNYHNYKAAIGCLKKNSSLSDNHNEKIVCWSGKDDSHYCI